MTTDPACLEMFKGLSYVREERIYKVGELWKRKFILPGE